MSIFNVWHNLLKHNILKYITVQGSMWKNPCAANLFDVIINFYDNVLKLTGIGYYKALSKGNVRYSLPVTVYIVSPSPCSC